MGDVDLLKISPNDFLENHLTIDNVYTFLRRVILEAPTEKRMEVYGRIAEKLCLPIEDIITRAKKIKSEINSFTSPLETLEARAIGIDDFLIKKFPERPYYLHPWLQPGSLVMIYGTTGIGKTFLRDSIALALTHGTNIEPWKVETVAGVLIVDGEMPCQSIQNRLKMLSHDLPKRKEPFVIVSAADLLSEGFDAPNLTSFSWRDGMIQYLENHPEIKIVVLDNVVSLFPGLDENLAKDWSPSNQWMIKLRAMGLAVIKIHHPTKKGNTARGTGLHDLNMDVVIQLRRPNGYQPGQGARFEIHFEKGRELYGEQTEPFIFQILSDPSNPEKLTWKTEKVSKQKPAKINENTKNIMLNLDKGIKQAEIAKTAGCTVQNISKIKMNAINNGILNNQGRFTEKGQKMYCADQDEDNDDVEDHG